MHLSVTITKLLICCVVIKWSPSTALQNFDERNELESMRDHQLDGKKQTQQLRRNMNQYSSQVVRSNRHNAAAGHITHLNEPEQTNIMFQQDLDQLKKEHSSSGFLSSESGGYQFNDQEQDQSLIQLCKRVDLNFAKAANGRGMSGGDFVRGEWFRGYGLNIYAKGHDGNDNIHPMIFDSANVNSNILADIKDLSALGSPNSDCGGWGVGVGGKEGKSGENCQPLGNVLIPSRKKSGSPTFNLNTRGRSYQPPLGGVLIFEFNKETKVDNIGFLNIGESDQIMAIHNDGSLENIELDFLGQNGFQNVPVDLDNVNWLYINLHSFGAVTGLDFCVIFD